MNISPDPEKEHAIVDVVLRDEVWESASAACKAQALRVFQARQRFRRLTRWAAPLAALGIAATCGVYWLSRPLPTKHQVARGSTQLPVQSDKPHDLSDQALVGLFPPGSCFIAEIDGQKELIFPDPNVERVFLSDVGARARSLLSVTESH